ncbi:MAG TPA: transporter substrate-binding domain-containing protein [Gammaproteobacteria bacterium]|nr:transporter substrate-binding domain-containing protein [Gammaproteobacteria bacterium]
MSANKLGYYPRLSLLALLVLAGWGLPAISTIAASSKTLVLNSAFSDILSNQKQTGFVDSIVKEALSRIGYKLKSIHLPAERALLNANAGIDDGDLLRIGGLQKIYPNLIQVPEKIMDMEFVVFTQHKSFPISGWQSLKTWSVAIITGWKILEQNITEVAELTKVKNADLLFTLLLKDRTDIIVYSRWPGLAYIKKHKLKNIKILEPPLDRRNMYVYLHKKYRHLVPELAASLRSMKQDGSYQRIFERILAPLE